MFLTVSADPYTNSMVEALSLSFRDQMSILLVFFAEIRHILRSESDDMKKTFFVSQFYLFHEILTDETRQAL